MARKTQCLEPVTTDDVVEAFEHLLRDKKPADLAVVSSFRNGFEGWLKFELALELAKSFGRNSSFGPIGDVSHDTIGVEHKAPLREKSKKKQVDLWVCSGDRDSWIYVELKVAFAKSNRGKQLKSFHQDCSFLEKIVEDGCDGRVALLVAVGFGRAELEAHAGGAAVNFLTDDAVATSESIAIVSKKIEVAPRRHGQSSAKAA